MKQNDASTPIFQRQYRTSSSEGYWALIDSTRLAQIELHFTHTVVYCTLILFQDLNEHERFALIEEIDERLVHSAEVPREDLMVTVFTGREVGFYNDDMFSHAHAEKERQNAPPEGDESGPFRN